MPTKQQERPARFIINFRYRLILIYCLMLLVASLSLFMSFLALHLTQGENTRRLADVAARQKVDSALADQDRRFVQSQCEEATYNQAALSEELSALAALDRRYLVESKEWILPPGLRFLRGHMAILEHYRKLLRIPAFCGLKSGP